MKGPHCVQWVLGVSAGRPRVTTSAAAAARRGDVVYYRTPRTTSSTLQQLFITPNYRDHQARIVDGRRRRRRWDPPRAYFRPPLLAAPSPSSDEHFTFTTASASIVSVSACRLSNVVVNTSLYPTYIVTIAYLVVFMCPFFATS